MPTKLDEQFEKALEKKFFCPTKFAQEIETLVLDNKNMNYIDAIIHFCDANSIDLESVPKLISKPLKEKIKFDATELNFLKRTSRAKLVFLIPKKSEKTSWVFFTKYPFQDYDTF